MAAATSDISRPRARGSRSARGPDRRAPRRGPARPPASDVESLARPARSATIRDSSRTWSSGRSSRSSGRASRSRRMSRQRHVDDEQALREERRAEQRLAVRGDHLGAAPEGDRLVDPDAIAEHDDRRRELGIGPHQVPPRGRRPEPDLVRRREVAAGRRRDVDQDLCPVERQELGHGQVPEVLADRQPDADSEPRRRRPQEIARGEEPPLVEQPVRGQEELPVDVPDLAVLEEGRGDEQAMIRRLLDERDDRGQVLASPPRGPPGAGRRGASRPPRRGPGAGSRSARAPGRRRGRRRVRAPRRSARDDGRGWPRAGRAPGRSGRGRP